MPCETVKLRVDGDVDDTIEYHCTSMTIEDVRAILFKRLFCTVSRENSAILSAIQRLQVLGGKGEVMRQRERISTTNMTCGRSINRN
jgi:hypothetical protein